MGHQINADDDTDNGVRFTDGAWLVINWCGGYPDDESGTIPAVSVALADEIIPETFEEAQATGFLTGVFRSPITKNEFEQCRGFLKYAADRRLTISGSY